MNILHFLKTRAALVLAASALFSTSAFAAPSSCTVTASAVRDNEACFIFGKFAGSETPSLQEITIRAFADRAKEKIDYQFTLYAMVEGKWVMSGSPMNFSIPTPSSNPEVTPVSSFVQFLYVPAGLYKVKFNRMDERAKVKFTAIFD